MPLIICLLLALTASPQRPPQRPPVDQVYESVLKSFANMKSLSADFEEIVNRKGSETGHLSLQEGRRMRWDYRGRNARYWVSNGKTLYVVDPAGKQVNKEAVSKSLDERIPLMFLLGNPELKEKIREYGEATDVKPLLPGDRVLRLIPREQDYLEKIEIEVEREPTYTIKRLLLVFADGGKSEIIFSNVRTNVKLDSSIFEFKTPPGWDEVQGVD